MSYEAWVESALAELRRAEERLRAGDYAYACFHCEQAAQHILKAFLIKHGNFIRTHDLVKLFTRARAHGLRLEMPEEDLRELMIHYAAARYPDARARHGIEYTEQIASRAYRIAKRIVEEVLRCIR